MTLGVHDRVHRWGFGVSAAAVAMAALLSAASWANDAKSKDDGWEDDPPKAAEPAAAPGSKPKADDKKPVDTGKRKDDDDWEDEPSTATQPATKPAAGKDPDDNAERVARLFDRHWSTYAKAFRPFGDDYVRFDYDAKFANSRFKSIDQAKDDLSTTQRVRIPGYNLMKDEKSYGPAGEAEAMASALPNLKPGSYGWVYSFVIDRVTGPEEMMVSQLWVLDREAMQRERQGYERKYSDRNSSYEIDKLFKLRRELQEMPERDRRWQHIKVVGFPTKDLALGSRWRGPRGKGVQVAFLGFERVNKQDSGRDTTQVPVLSPADALKNGLSKEQFRDLLTKRGYTPEEFVNLVRSEHRSAGSKESVAAVLTSIEMGRVKDKDHHK